MFEEYQEVASKWCGKFYDQTNAEKSLRPRSLLPKIDIRDFNISEQLKKNEIQRLHKLRVSEISEADSSASSLGRVLRYYPDRSLGDGLLCDKTNGFFTEEEVPPWGTWFYFEKEPNENENILYSWVPISLCKSIDKALENDFYDCLVWHN